MALRILQFGIVFAIGYYLGPASPFAGAADVPEVPLPITLRDPEVPLPITLRDPEDVTVGRGQSAVLRCDAKSQTPDLRITWYYNDKPIKNNDTKWYVQSDGSLNFTKVGGGNKGHLFHGEYRCRASAHNVSLLSNPAKLKIASFGDFATQPSNLSILESQPSVIFCKIKAVPAAHIQWEQNTKPLPHNKRYVPLPTGALLITKTHSSDAGAYRCIATNKILKKTKHSKIVQLTVSPIPMQTVAPTFLPLDILPNTSVLVGQTVNLYCAVNGWPIPTVQWLNSSIVISNSSVLQIQNASFYDTGNYTCTAYNSGGRVTKLFTLNVQQKPYFNVTPVSKTYPPAKTVRLDCAAEGVPQPKIHWLKNGEPLPNAARFKTHSSGLVISHTFTSDSGVYQCVAVNAVGRVWAAAMLVPTYIDTPSPPENVQCRAFDEKSLCLNWKTPENVSVIAYSVYCYYTAMGRETMGGDYVTNKTSHLATDLLPSTNYTCYVRLYSNIASDDSQKVTCKTGIKGRRNLQVIPFNETSVELTWSKMSIDVPCESTKELYKVQWRGKGHFSINSNYTEGFSYIIFGLNPSVEYEFRVIPAWNKTNSPWVSYTPKNNKGLQYALNVTDWTPIAPENLAAGHVSPTSINLTWTDGNENTRFYSICMVESKNYTECDEKDLLKSASTSLLITDLQPNCSYNFKVRAHSYQGSVGLFSEFATLRTHADVPSKVLNLNYHIVNQTTVCLHWRAPLHKNGKLLSYLILYTPDANMHLEDWFNKSIPSTQDKLNDCRPGDNQTFSTLLADLKEDTQYTVYVRAASEVGLGNPMYPIKISTKNIKNVEQQAGSQDEVKYNQNLGIIMGVLISLLCIILCVSCTILMRKRCLKTRAFSRARLAASNNYYPGVAQYASEGSSVQVRLENPCSAAVHEIEHLVGEDCADHIPPDTTHLDTKWSDGFPNGHVNGSAKPYVNGHIANGVVHITENPRYYALECNGHVNKKLKSPDFYEEDSNSNLKTSKLQDLHRLLENSKLANKPHRQCNLQLNNTGKLSVDFNSSFKDVRPNG